MKLSGVEKFHMARVVNVCFFALKTCDFLKIALNNSQTRRPKLARRSTQLRTVEAVALILYRKTCKRQRRASLFSWEWIMLFLWAFFLFNRGPRGGNGGSWGQRSIERIPSSTASSRPAVPGAAIERQKRQIWVLPLFALSITPSRTDTLPDSPHLYVWQPFLWQFRLMKEDFS